MGNVHKGASSNGRVKPWFYEKLDGGEVVGTLLIIDDEESVGVG